MTKADHVAIAFLVVIVLALGWLKDELISYFIHRPSLRTRMYLQSRKERKK